MPAYDKSGFHVVRALVQGVPLYLFGSWPISVAPTRFLITQVSAALTVATITGAVIEGNIPVVGALISIRQTSSNGGLFNVTNAAITAVAINSTTGIGTIQFTYGGTTFGPDSSPAAAGLAIIPQPEVGETLVAGASIACTMPVQDPKTDSARTISVALGFPTPPTSVTVDLQAAIFDQDSEYTKQGTSITTTNAPVVAEFTLNTARFYRFNVSNLVGSGTIIAKILV